MPVMDPTREAFEAVEVWLVEHRPELVPLFRMSLLDESNDPRGHHLLRAFTLLGFQAGRSAATDGTDRFKQRTLVRLQQVDGWLHREQHRAEFDRTLSRLFQAMRLFVARMAADEEPIQPGDGDL